jgi:hypothetical protein
MQACDPSAAAGGYTAGRLGHGPGLLPSRWKPGSGKRTLPVPQLRDEANQLTMPRSGAVVMTVSLAHAAPAVR